MEGEPTTAVLRRLATRVACIWRQRRHKQLGGQIPNKNNHAHIAQSWGKHEQGYWEQWRNHWTQGDQALRLGKLPTNNEEGQHSHTPGLFDIDIRSALLERPSCGRLNEHVWTEIIRVANMCGSDYMSWYSTNSMYEYNKTTLRKMLLHPATFVAALTIHPRYLNWRLHTPQKPPLDHEKENDDLVRWVQTAQNTFPEVMTTWANARKHCLLMDLRTQHGWSIVSKPLELDPISVMSISCTESTALDIPLTTEWMTAVRTARVGAREEQPRKRTRGEDNDRQTSLEGRRALVRTLPKGHRRVVNSIRQIHAFLEIYGQTLGGFVPISDKSMCVIAFRHREDMLAAIKSHPNGRSFFINGQTVSIVEARMRGDEYTMDENIQRPPSTTLWDSATG